MPISLKAPPSDAPVGQQKKGNASSVAVIPFARASKYHIEQGDTRSAIAINVAAPGTFNFPIPSYGYLAAVLLTVSATGGSGTAAVFYEDAPWSAIQTITLNDTNGTPIMSLSGYHAFLAAKYGGYRPYPLDGSTASGVFNAGSTNGNFQFTLPIWLEFGRDGMGSLRNSDASARYSLQVVLASGVAASTGPLYTTQPTGYPTVSLTVEGLFRSIPPAVDMFGNHNSLTPPADGTVQYWSAQTASALTGAQTLQLTRVGNLIRNHILVFRDTSNGTRATADASDMPSLIEMDWDTGVRYISNTSTQKLLTFMNYGQDGPKGVILYPNTTDPDHTVGAELGDEWMATLGSSKLTFRFTPAASVGLTVLTNDIVPASGQVYNAPVLQLGQ